MIFRGRITSSGFESGDSLVIGDWTESPLGAFTNIMWSKPDGSRVLLSPSPEHADFVSSLYDFDEVVVTEIIVNRNRKTVSIKTDCLQVSMSWGYHFRSLFQGHYGSSLPSRTSSEKLFSAQAPMESLGMEAGNGTQ